MLTIQILETLLENKQHLQELAKGHGYVDLRLFKQRYEEDKDTLHIMGRYDTSLMQEKTGDQPSEPIEETFTKLLGYPVVFWPENAEGIQPQDVEQANLAPLADAEKCINYFVEMIIPYSTGDEPTQEMHEAAKNLLAKYINYTNVSAQSVFFKAKKASGDLVAPLTSSMESLSFKQEDEGKTTLPSPQK